MVACCMWLEKKYPLTIGDEVTVGHNATLHACTIESRCLIGMGATVMDGSTIGKNCIVGAGSLVTPSTTIQPGSLVIGAPAKVKRKLTEKRNPFDPRLGQPLCK